MCYLALVLEAEEGGAVKGVLWKGEPINPGNDLDRRAEGVSANVNNVKSQTFFADVRKCCFARVVVKFP